MMDRHAFSQLDSEPAAARAETRSLIAWLVLALVIERPSHGYEINKRFEGRFGRIVATSSSSIYAALDRLYEEGMIETVTLEQSERPRRQHRLRRSYRATHDGARAYRGWVAERMRDDPDRLRLLGRIASGGLLGIAALRDVVDRYVQGCLEEMRNLPMSGGSPDAPGCGTLTELADELVIEQQRLELRARIAWGEYAHKRLRDYERFVEEERDENEPADA